MLRSRRSSNLRTATRAVTGECSTLVVVRAKGAKGTRKTQGALPPCSGYNAPPPQQQYTPAPATNQYQNQYAAAPAAYGNGGGDAYAMQTVNGAGSQSLIGSDMGPFFAEVSPSVRATECWPSFLRCRVRDTRADPVRGSVRKNRSRRSRTRSSSCTKTSTTSRSCTRAGSLRPTT